MPVKVKSTNDILVNQLVSQHLIRKHMETWLIHAGNAINNNPKYIATYTNVNYLDDDLRIIREVSNPEAIKIKRKLQVEVNQWMTILDIHNTNHVYPLYLDDRIDETVSPSLLDSDEHPNYEYMNEAEMLTLCEQLEVNIARLHNGHHSIINLFKYWKSQWHIHHHRYDHTDAFIRRLDSERTS